MSACICGSDVGVSQQDFQIHSNRRPHNLQLISSPHNPHTFAQTSIYIYIYLSLSLSLPLSLSPPLSLSLCVHTHTCISMCVCIYVCIYKHIHAHPGASYFEKPGGLLDTAAPGEEGLGRDSNRLGCC